MTFPVNKRTAIAAALGVSALVAMLVTALVVRNRYWPNAAVMPGLSIDGEPISAGVDVRELVAVHAKALASRKLHLTVPGDKSPILDATLEEMGLVVDVDETSRIA